MNRPRPSQKNESRSRIPLSSTRIAAPFVLTIEIRRCRSYSLLIAADDRASVAEVEAKRALIEARRESSIQLPSGSRIVVFRATSPSVTGARPSQDSLALQLIVDAVDIGDLQVMYRQPCACGPERIDSCGRVFFKQNEAVSQAKRADSSRPPLLCKSKNITIEPPVLFDASDSHEHADLCDTVVAGQHQPGRDCRRDRASIATPAPLPWR